MEEDSKRRPLLFCLTCMMLFNTDCLPKGSLPTFPFACPLDPLPLCSGADLSGWVGRELPPPVKQMDCFIHHTLGKIRAFLSFYSSSLFSVSRFPADCFILSDLWFHLTAPSMLCFLKTPVKLAHLEQISLEQFAIGGKKW